MSTEKEIYSFLIARRFFSGACSSTVEQSAHNALVAGSNPAGPTKMENVYAFSISFFRLEI